MKSIRTKNRRGSAILEATFTVVLFYTILFSLFDFSWELFYYQTLMNQVRAGARYGAVNPGSTTAIQNMVLYNSTTGSGSGVLGLTSSNVSISRTGTAGGANDSIVVTLTGYHYTLITFVWAGSHGGPSITASMPVEN
jgi:hypothetical protein